MLYFLIKKHVCTMFRMTSSLPNILVSCRFSYQRAFIAAYVVPGTR